MQAAINGNRPFINNTNNTNVIIQKQPEKNKRWEKKSIS